MGFFSAIFGGGKTKLSDAVSSAPTGSGCYKVYYRGDLMKVGKAEDGLRKRFQQYYRMDSSGGLKYITSSNRDQTEVTWTECSQSECRALETKWYDEAKSKGEELPWSDRR